MARTLSYILVILSLALATAGCEKLQNMGKKEGGDLKTDTDKTLYALGQLIGGNIKTFDLTDTEFATVVSGMRDATKGGEPKVKMEEYGPKVQAFAQTRAQKHAKSEAKKGKAFAEKMAKEKGAKKLPSGLVYIEQKAGNGKSPAASDKVKVHYHGTLIDGEVFDSSRERKEPVDFPLDRVVPCWTEGLQLMKAGGKAKLVCPPELAYGEQGRPPKIPGGSTLVFEVELLEVGEGSGSTDAAQSLMSQ